MIDVYLGDAYQQIGDFDRQISAYRRAVTLDPSWFPARERLAGALLAVGRVDEALEEYRNITTRPNSSIQAPLNLVKLMMMQKLRRGEKDNWNVIEDLLSRLESQAPGNEELLCLRSEVYRAQGQWKRPGKSSPSTARANCFGPAESSWSFSAGMEHS